MHTQSAAVTRVEPLALQEFFTLAGVQDRFDYASKILVTPEGREDFTPYPHQIRDLNQALTNERFGLFNETATGKTLPIQCYCLYQAGLKNRVVVAMPPVLLEQFAESFSRDFPGYERFFRLHTLNEGPTKRYALFDEWRENDSWPDFMLMSYQMFSKVPRARKVKETEVKLGAKHMALYKQLVREQFLELPDSEIINARQALALRQKCLQIIACPELVTRDKFRNAILDMADRLLEREILEPPNPDDFVSGVLKKHGYNVLVADEAHALKSGSSSMHKTVKHFLGQPGESACVLATGTPIKNTLLDAFGLIQLINPGRYSSFRAFERAHAVYQEGDSGHAKLTGFKNKLLITANLYAYARRITKDQVFSVKKPRIQEVEVRLGTKHMALYKQLVRERFLELPDGEIINALQAQSLRQKALQIITCPELFTPDKFVNAILDMADQLLDSIGVETKKVIIFCHYRKSVESLAKHYKKLNPAVIYGGTPNKNREKNKFLQDDSCRILIANVVSAGTGLNLHSVCSNAIFLEPCSVPGDFRQAADRLRIGHPNQRHVVSIYILKALGTLAPKLTRSMLAKESENMSVLMDRTSLLAELMGIV